MSPVIKIENLWKEYRLGVIGHGTLTHDLQSWWARKCGKVDPNAKITPMLAGQEKQIDGDHFWALRDINLEVKQGEILGIIGKNGAGKSTLLKILSRVTAPSRGNIKVKGRIASLLEVGTGFHAELTGRENIFMNGAILGMSKSEIRDKLDEIIDFSGVEDFVDTPVKRYSSGMYVRLAFAVAAHLEPEILVVDEVLAVGDADFQKKCLGKMSEISGKEGRTIIFVSHNMGAVSEICNSAIIMKNGKVSFFGKTDDVIHKYLYTEEQKTFNQQTDLLDYRSRRGTGSCRFRSIKVLNVYGEESFSYRRHDTVEFHFEVEVNFPTEQLMFYMQFETLSSSQGLGSTPYLTVPAGPFGKGELVYFKVIFRDIQLNPGQYPMYFWLSGSIHSEPVDLVDKILPNLKIESEGTTDLISYVTLENEIEMNPPDLIN